MTQAMHPNPAALPTVRYKSRDARRMMDRLFVSVCLFAAAMSIVTLVTLLTSIIAQALGFDFDHWFPMVALGLSIFGVGASTITIVATLRAVVTRRATRLQAVMLAAGLVAWIASVITLIVLWNLREGPAWLTWSFLTGVPSRFASEAGIWPATVGTIMICAVCALSAIPIGVATAILLEEYRPKRRWLQKPHAFVQLNITNLAGVPSIVYGILGLTVFVQMFNALGTPLDPSWESGVQHYDRFVTEGGTAVQVPIDSRNAEPTDPAAVDRWLTVEGEAMDIRLVSREAFAPLAEEVDSRVDAFTERVGESLDAAPEASVAVLVTKIEEAWAAAGLQADVDAVKQPMAEGLVEARGLSGRDARRVRRNALELAEAAERRAVFPGIIVADAYPSRISDTQPWYIRIPFGRGVLAGGLTLMLVVLPIVIISSQEALRAVPRSMRYASLALGATPWQTVWKITLPTAIPGIMTGTILAMSRAIGEAAPILVIAGIVYITFTPNDLMDDFTAMPLQIFNWTSRPQQEFHDIAAAGIIILMAILLTFNAIAVFIRQRTQKQY